MGQEVMEELWSVPPMYGGCGSVSGLRCPSMSWAGGVGIPFLLLFFISGGASLPEVVENWQAPAGNIVLAFIESFTSKIRG